MYPSRYDYEDCIRVYREHSRPDARVCWLIWVAGAWTAKVPVTHEQLATARAIVSRMDEKVDPYAIAARVLGAQHAAEGWGASEPQSAEMEATRLEGHGEAGNRRTSSWATQVDAFVEHCGVSATTGCGAG